MEGAVQDRATFQGIARTLLALALLAERAAGRSFPVRFLVLVILGRAEAIARAYVVREIEAEGWCLDLSCLDERPGMHFGAAGAEFLALRLRMLAAVLGALADADAASAGLSDGRSAGGADTASAYGSAVRAASTSVAKDLPLLLVVRFPAARHCRPHDTS